MATADDVAASSMFLRCTYLLSQAMLKRCPLAWAYIAGLLSAAEDKTFCKSQAQKLKVLRQEQDQLWT